MSVPDREERGNAQSAQTQRREPDRRESGSTTVTSLPKAPLETQRPRSALPRPAEGSPEVKEVTVSLQSMALPQFIETVFGTILKRNISIDPQLQQRKDVVSLKTGQKQAPEQLFVAARAVLRSYGVTVQEFDGLLRFLPDNADSGYMPEIRRGRADPDVPDSLRPVFYLVELENTPVASAAAWLRSMFQAKITLQEDSQRNSMLISGAPSAVSAAMEALRTLDQPLMRGRISARISPAYMTAEELARRLSEALTAEGYQTGTSAALPSPIILVPVGAVNAVFVFASSQEVLDHIVAWAGQFDQPSQLRGSGNYIIYAARNTDAANLAKTLQDVVGGGGTVAAAGAATAATPATSSRSSRIVVNAATNSLIIQASASEFQQWRELLEALDRPARSALISVTVADVSLTDSQDIGVSFEAVLQTAILKGLKFVVSNSGTGGLSGAWLRTDSTLTLPSGSSNSTGWTTVDPRNPKAVVNALAQLNKTRILSNPSVLTRSGETATISVGDDVPTLSSTVTSTLGNTVQQNVQYRKTGVTLKVRPVVHSSGRIDLEVSQEVSNQQGSGVANSPIIKSSNLDTKLTVADGGTVILGGLMSFSNSDLDSGTPGLKDIPGLGVLFKNNSTSREKRELVMLVTAYAVEDEYDTEAISDAFRNRMPWISPLVQEKGISSGSRVFPAPPTVAPDTRTPSAPAITDLRDPEDRQPVRRAAPAAPTNEGTPPLPSARPLAPTPPAASSAPPAASSPVPGADAKPPSPGGATRPVVSPDLLDELRRAVEGSQKR